MPLSRKKKRRQIDGHIFTSFSSRPLGPSSLFILFNYILSGLLIVPTSHSGSARPWSSFAFFFGAPPPLPIKGALHFLTVFLFFMLMYACVSAYTLKVHLL